jgi:serine/threonine-protein kinase HipA
LNALDVFLDRTRVGLLERLDEFEYRFSFDAAWLDDAQHPVLGQIFEDRKPRDIESTGTVPCWFDHLLPPQGVPLRRAIAQQCAVDEEDAFALLGFLGEEDLPGAVILRPGEPSLSPPAQTRPTPEPRNDGPLRFALAGQQWKLSLREKETKLTLPLRGETGDVIAKFPSPAYADLPRVEFATMTWAKLAGVDVPPIRLAHASAVVDLPAGIPLGDGTLYIIERFDRKPDGTRVHFEDFGQVLDRPADDRHLYVGAYEHMAAFVAYLPAADLRAFCERLVFCVVCGNTDAHVKNWAVLYPDGRHPRLAPAYDLIASVLYAPPVSDELALALHNSKKFEDVSVESFRAIAHLTRRPFDEVASWVTDMTGRILDAWRASADAIPFTLAERARLEQHLARVPLARGR